MTVRFPCVEHIRSNTFSARINLYNGIDRKNSSEGYTLGNSLPCCRVCNRAKSDMDYEEFKQWIKDIKGNCD